MHCSRRREGLDQEALPQGAAGSGLAGQAQHLLDELPLSRVETESELPGTGGFPALDTYTLSLSRISALNTGCPAGR